MTMSVVFSPDLLRVQNYIREKAGVPPLPDPDTMLLCSTCKEWKPDDEFYRHSKSLPSRRGKRWDCKTCGNAKRTEWRQNNYERDKARERAYRRERTKDKPSPRVRNMWVCACGQEIAALGFAQHKVVCQAWLDSQEDV